jgi:ABC-type phosphate transport system permease subunit
LSFKYQGTHIDSFQRLLYIITVIIMQKEVIEKIAALITAAFGLIAALAWNEAIQEIFRLVFGDQSGIWAMLFYAVVVTIIAVVVTIWIGRVAEKHTGKKVEGT